MRIEENTMNQPFWNESNPAEQATTDVLHEQHDEFSTLTEPAQEVLAEPSPTVGLSDPLNFTDYYGLKSNPFSDSVNPAFFYRTTRHDETYIMMTLAIRNHLSLGLVTGPSGSGKTLISQLVLNNLSTKEVQPVLVLVSPGMSKTALMKEILSELNIAVPDGHFTSTQDLLKLLSDYVIDLYQQNRKLVIIIDECHFLSSESLHMVRTLTNIEVPARKLVTCLLFGEQRFLKRLNHPAHDSLRNRMYMRGELGPLNASECAEFVKFRLLKSGRMDDLFDRPALTALHECSGGICRNINKLAMLCLLEGSMRRKTTIDEETVRLCANRM